MSHGITYLQAVLLCLHICTCAVAAQCRLDRTEGVCQATYGTGLEPNSTTPAFSYWIDFHTFLQLDGARVYDKALAALGGQRVGPVPMLVEQFEKQLPQRSTIGKHLNSGCHNMSSWDIYVTASPRALTQASYLLSPGQLMCSMLGTSAVTGKQKLVRTLRAYYGQDGADALVPRTFLLPDERSKWQEWVQNHHEQDTGFWLLKTDQHRAEGLSLVPTLEAHAASFRLPPKGREWTIAQQYITNPLLLGARKFSVRLHVFIPAGLDPFRVYINKRGFALVAGDDYAPAGNSSSSTEVASQDLPTELSAVHFTNNPAQIGADGSGLRELASIRQGLGEDVWKALWDSMTKSTAHIMAAALADIRATNSKMQMPARGAYELFGIDFLIDDNMHAWVTEVNAGPSMTLGTEDSHAGAVRRFVKVQPAQDMYSMMRLQDRKWNQPQNPVLDMNEIEAELRLRGTWLPLMHLFPQHAASTVGPSGIRDIPWSAADVQLQGWIKYSPAYKQAIADWY